MSNDIEEAVVEMKFNNAAFEQNTKQTLSTLDKLKNALKLDGAKKNLDDLDKSGKKFSLSGIAQGIDNISSKFTALGVVGITALANIANKAINVGTSLVKSITLDPITDGFREYETQINAVQTILANTASKGINLKQVNSALAELNTYADKTIYNFTEMTKNIGTFTAAGVGLNASVQAIKGISNLAAVSGSNAQQASTAMYQLSQALASGTVKLQDWNSVVNAGMGGQVFQDALKETARVHGVKIDEMIKKEGSFRETLKNGWLTSKILTETLSKFTGDLSEAQLKSMGYSEEQIKGIIKLGKMSNDAATKVKTFSQLIDTLKEAVGSGWAQTWQTLFGDFEEAKKLYTGVSNVLGKLINDSSNARNNVLKDWKALGGRAVIIEGITNLFKNFMKIARVIGSAFKDIFPPATGKQLYELTYNFLLFTKNFKLAGADLENLKKTFRGFFALLHIGWSVVSGVAGVVYDLVSSFSGSKSGILDFTGSIGDFLVSLDKAISDGEGLTKFLDGLKSALQVPINLLKAFGSLLVDALDGLNSDGLKTFGHNIVESFKPLAFLGEVISKTVSGMVKAVSSALAYMQPLFDLVARGFQWMAEQIQASFSHFDISNLSNLFNAAMVALILNGIRKFVKGLGGGLSDAKGIIENIKGAFEGITGVLEAMQQNLKAGTLIKIAGALALLTLSIVALSMIDPVDLGKAMIAIQIMFLQLNAAMSGFGKIAGGKGMAKMPLVMGSLIALAIAIDILATAVKKLSGLDWQGIAKGLVGVGGLLASLSLFMKFTSASKMGPIQALGLVVLAVAVNQLATAAERLGQMDLGTLVKGIAAVGVLIGLLTGFTAVAKNAKGMIFTATGILILSAALEVMTDVVGKLGALDIGTIGKGLGSIAAMLLILAGAMRLMPKGMMLQATSLVILAGALNILSDALSKMGSMSLEQIGKGLLAMAGALLILAGAMLLMPKGMLLQAAGLVVVAEALVIIGDALKTMGGMSWEEIAKGMVTLAGALGIIAVAMILMTEALPGAAALLVVAASLAILAPILQAFGKMSWEEIGKGMVVLAGALTILLLAAAAAVPLAPGLLILAASILLIGVGTAAAGAGMLAFALGLTALAAAGAAGVTALSLSIVAIASLIPFIAQKVGEGIIALITVIASSGKAITEGFVTILMSLITAVSTVAPAIIDALVKLIVLLVNALVKMVPFLVNAGLKLLLGLLSGIRDNISKIVTVASDIIVRFITAIGNNAGKITTAGANMIIKFVNSLADTIEKKSGEMRSAGARLAKAIIDGMTGGLWSGVQWVIDAARGVAERAIGAAAKALDINSPSKKFLSLGKSSSEGLAMGMTRYGYMAERSARSVGENILTAVKQSLTELSDISSTDIDANPKITPVLDLSQVNRDASLIAGALGKQSIKLDSALSMANSISAEQAANAETPVATEPVKHVEVNFNQTNNSPKALSEIDIYRQTRNQISQLEGALGE